MIRGFYGTADKGHSLKVYGPILIGNVFKKRGKAIPLQARTGPESSRSLRLPDFKTIGT